MKDIPSIIVILILIGISSLIGSPKRKKKRQQEVCH